MWIQTGLDVWLRGDGREDNISYEMEVLCNKPLVCHRGEAEYYALTKGASYGLGTRAFFEDWDL